MQSFKAELFKALGHPMRIRILELLRTGEKNVGELMAALGVEGTSVSQQLAILRMKNIVDSRRDGTTIYYRLKNERVNELLDAARRMFDEQLGDLRAIGRTR